MKEDFETLFCVLERAQDCVGGLGPGVASKSPRGLTYSPYYFRVSRFPAYLLNLLSRLLCYWTVCYCTLVHVASILPGAVHVEDSGKKFETPVVKRTPFRPTWKRKEAPKCLSPTNNAWKSMSEVPLSPSPVSLHRELTVLRFYLVSHADVSSPG